MVVERELGRHSLKTSSKLKGLIKKKKCSKNIVTGLKSIITLGWSHQPVALDCEMVGVGEKKESALGRISIVSYYGQVLYDVMCRPEEVITDYRTPWSGIRPTDMVRAIPFECVQDQVQRIIEGRIVVGHMVFNDFHVLKMQHPKDLIRDTGLAPYAKVKAGFHPRQPTALRNLAEKLLGLRIQTGEHCSTEDAQATMAIYRLVEEEWEADLRVKTSKKKSKVLQPSPKKRPIFDLELPSLSDDQCSSDFSALNPNPLNCYPPLALKSCSSSSLLLEDEYWDDC
uniref:RNA exonuclease 4 n=1 Tax=Schistocephalus solidus TaxID=70667 RepID=A0A0X3PKV6_SCHSO